MNKSNRLTTFLHQHHFQQKKKVRIWHEQKSRGSLIEIIIINKNVREPNFLLFSFSLKQIAKFKNAEQQKNNQKSN